MNIFHFLINLHYINPNNLFFERQNFDCFIILLDFNIEKKIFKDKVL